MDTTRYCAFNKSRGIFLSLDVNILDAALEPLKVLKVLIEGPEAEARAGIWLQRFKAVPVAQALEPFDLIYLDKDFNVVHAVALTVDGAFQPFEGNPTSALVLPAGTIALSDTNSGDQLIVVSAPQAATVPARIAVPSVPKAKPAAAAATSLPPAPATAHTIPAAAFAAESAEPSPLDRFLATQGRLASPPPSAAAPPPAAPTRPAAWTTPFAADQPREKTAEPWRPPARPAYIPPPRSHVRPPVEEFFAARPHPPAVSEQTTPSFALPEAPQDVLAPVQPKPEVEYYREPAPSLTTRVLRWLMPHSIRQSNGRRMRDRRTAYRLDNPGLVAYFFTGGAPRPHAIQDISVTGFFMHTDHLYMPGTIVRMTLQLAGTRGDQPGDAVTVHSRMVRHEGTGGGFEFVLSGFLD